jgi:Ca2+-binding RTX toxin-like protein/methionine-rich copper-binding protein CopC
MTTIRTSAGHHTPLRLRVSSAAWALLAALLVASLVPLSVVGVGGGVGAAPVGQGFNLNASDLRFIFKQIEISENHVATTTTATGQCGALLGPGAHQIPNNGVGVTLPWGLRTVDGSCNNLVPNQQDYGTADRKFPRLVPKKLVAAENGTSYTQTSGQVTDSQPRIISNLIVDQTPQNPAAEEAAGSDAVIDPDSGAYVIPNVAPDVGLSAPYNSWFTLFGQFFDHGLDLVSKGGAGHVFMPLMPDDPLHCDVGEPCAQQGGLERNFMILTRATHGGDHEATNQTSPFVDQSQTYTSHPSHQVFLREYVSDATTGHPTITGRLITGVGDGMAQWSDVKSQSASILGIALTDRDALSVPLVVTDPYGRFVPGAAGFPQLVLTDGTFREGNPDAPVTTEGAQPSGHAFLDDIAHHAVPVTSTGEAKQPDADPSTTDDHQPGTYDDEMLDAHFMAGDGRVNENIGLIAVHHVFHSEHNRLAGDIDALLESAAFTDAERAEWHRTDFGGGWDYGERLFQAARFVTEMEYQHLAFEEFIRKVQPMVNPFGEGGTGYHTEIDAAIAAEFAHAVYRFGHSMLTESVDRVQTDGTTDDVSLIGAFLNPPQFLDGYANPKAAAGAVVRGMTRQVGNELDEFVTEALRNQLLGLPLDLAALNMARARDTGTPTLNAARRSFYAQTGNTALQPYTSWADFTHSLKHRQSLVNFIAAYGTHPTITSAVDMATKRAAAELLVAADASNAATPVDAYAFMNSTSYEITDPTTGDVVSTHSEWESVDGVTVTGVDTIDLWVGGLAERQIVFGGLLGPTFNYVFELQAESLQDGDRFYYLSRTAGLNLLTQLEGNSFAELIQRNTDVESLPSDVFSRPDLVFNLANLGTSGPIPDDPSTPDYDESKLLIRQPDGTIRYSGPAHVVFNGRDDGNDRIRSSEGDDTLRGNGGNDRLEGGDGADNLIGGLGDDILTDLAGDDTLKGGDGNDVLSSGQGFGGDLNQGGRGDDFIIGGNDMTETFAGPGDDVVYAGDGEDTVFGDDGDDWIEGGKGPFNLLQGDNGAPFQDDPNEAGHDVLMGFGGETDNDAEGGDDIMFAGSLIQRNEGMLGFDWVTYKGIEVNPQPADADMRFTAFTPPSQPVDVNRDRFDLVESLSGWNLNDVLRGDDRGAAEMVGHELGAEGIARIEGLAGLLPAGVTSFTGGNIILGGAGSDVIEGRGGNDIIDGDSWLDVQLRAPDVSTTDTSDTRLFDTIAGLRADVLAGRINPGTIDIVRMIRTPDGTGSIDTAVFSGPAADYVVTTVAEGRTIVAHQGGTAADGTDTLLNIEQLRFSDGDIPVPVPDTNAPSVVSTVPTSGAAVVSTLADVTVTFSETVLGVDATTFTLQSGTTPIAAAVTFDPVTRVATLNPDAELAPVSTFTVSLIGGTNAIRDVAGNPLTSMTWNFTTRAAGDTVAPTVVAVTPVDGSAAVRASTNVTAQFSETVTGVDATSFTLTNTGTNASVAANVRQSTATGEWVLDPNRNLANGTYRAQLSTAITDTAVNPLAAAVTWNFTVGTGATPGTPDTTAPTVTGRTPAPGATGVTRSTDVAVTFSEIVTGVTTSTFLLRNTATGVTVTAQLSSGANGSQWRLRTNANLAAGTQYTVELRNGITDTAGNPLIAESWNFATR